MSKRIVLLQALTSAPTDPASVLKGISGAAVQQLPAPNQWAIADAVNHLSYIEPLYLDRLQRVMEMVRPSRPNILPVESHNVV